MKYQYIGENSLLFQFGDTIAVSLPPKIATIASRISEQFGIDILELTPSYTTLLVEFSIYFDERQLIQLVGQLVNEPYQVDNDKALITLPACYDAAIAQDLTYAASQLNLTIDSVIHLHSQQVYTVAAIGFLPGFPFMASVVPQLVLPRKQTPSTVPTGSIAIAETQTAIYPSTSLGGWHVIARCPIPLFNRTDPSLSILKAGDRVQFQPITLAQYYDLGSSDD